MHPKITHFLQRGQALIGHRSWHIALSLLVLGIAGFIVWAGIYVTPSDIITHNGFAHKVHLGEMQYRPHFLYYLVLSLTTFFSTNLNTLHLASIAILTPWVWFKYQLARQYLFGELQAVQPDGSRWWAASLLGISFIFIFNLPVNLSATIYLGQVTPNFWHNSTGIFLVPFALLLFFEAKKFLFGDNGRPWLLLLLFVVNIVIKPNYFMLMAIVLPLWAFVQRPFSKKFWVLSGLIGLAALVMVWQYVYFYHSGSSGRSLGIGFLDVWHIWSDNVLISFLASVPLPLAYLLLCFKEARQDKSFLLAGCLFLVGMIFYTCFVEKGPDGKVMLDGNFGWGAVIANIVLHLATIAGVSRTMIGKDRLRKADVFVLLIFLAQVGTGLVYLAKYPIFGYR